MSPEWRAVHQRRGLLRGRMRSHRDGREGPLRLHVGVRRDRRGVYDDGRLLCRLV